MGLSNLAEDSALSMREVMIDYFCVREVDDSDDEEESETEEDPTSPRSKSSQITVSTSNTPAASASWRYTSNEDSYIKFALGLVGDYLSVALEEQLKDVLGIKEKEAPVSETSDVIENEPPKKALKMDISPTEDYSQKYGLKKGKSEGKLTAAQKKLKKVDKSGMKSISSFFSKPVS